MNPSRCQQVIQRSTLARRSITCLATLVALTMQTAAALAGTILFPSSGTGSLANLAFPASMTISRDASIGTVLSSEPANVGLSASGVTCDVQKNVTVNGTAVSGDAQTLQTNVPGIGVRFYITNGWNGGFVQVPISQTLVSPTGSTAHYTRADLVVTGPVGAGSLTTLPSMNVTFTGSCITTATTTQYLTTGSAIASNTCSVTTPALVFNLPKGLSKNLSTVGATTGDITLPIGLN